MLPSWHPPPPLPTPPPQPVVVNVAGLVKSTNGAPTAAGFIDQTAQGRIPYANGTVTYPPGTPTPATGQPGVLSVSLPGVGTGTLSPLTPGATTAVTAS